MSEPFHQTFFVGKFIYIIILMNQIIIISSSFHQINELKFFQETSIHFDYKSDLCFYLDISRMKYTEKAIITFRFRPELFKQIKRNAQYALEFLSALAKANALNESTFQNNFTNQHFHAEQAYEALYEPNFNTVYHLYFNKTINEAKDVYLLIQIHIKGDTIDKTYTNEPLWISPVSLIEDETGPFITFIKPLKANIPRYIAFDLKNVDSRDNMIFYCSDNIMTVYYGNFDESNKVFTPILAMNQYEDQDFNHDYKIILKFMSKENVAMTLEIYISLSNNPLMIIHSANYPKINSIEMIKQNKKTIVAWYCFWRSFEYLLSIEKIYGISTIYYSNQLSIKKSPELKNPILIKDKVIPLKNHLYFFEITCDSPCRLDMVIFDNYWGFNELENTISYKEFTNEDFQTHTSASGDAMIAIEFTSLNDKFLMVQDKNRNEIKGKQAYTLEQSDRRIFYISTKGSNTYVRKKYHSNFLIQDVSLGSSKYTFETIFFKFNRNINIDSYIIELRQIDDKETEDYFYYYYGYGDNILPADKKDRIMNVNGNKTLIFSNPYDKINQIIIGNDEFYYFSISNIKHIVHTYEISFTQKMKDESFPIPINTPRIINSEANSTIEKYSFYYNDKLNKLILNFYQCSNEQQFNYQLMYNKDIIENTTLDKTNAMISIDNYYVNYTIDFNQVQSKPYSFIFHYTYRENLTIEHLIINNDYTINHTIYNGMIQLQWMAYITNKFDQIYYIYLSEYDSNKNHCSFINNKPYDMIYYSDSFDDDHIIHYTFKDLQTKMYRVNIMTQENKKYFSSHIYDELIITFDHHRIVINVMILLFVIMGISCLFLGYLSIKIKGRYLEFKIDSSIQEVLIS